MERRATETAEFLKFFDNVFDSVNGYGLFNIHGKLLRTGVDVLSEQTPHTEFWYNAVKVIESMYAKDLHGKRSVPPTFKNWVFTLKNFILLRNVLKEVGFKRFNPRFLNQDPLENYFGQIRQRGGRFVNPTVAAFGQHFKSLLVNNLTSRQSVGANCEEDNCNVLVTLTKFISVSEVRLIYSSFNKYLYHFVSRKHKIAQIIYYLNHL